MHVVVTARETDRAYLEIETRLSTRGWPRQTLVVMFDNARASGPMAFVSSLLVKIGGGQGASVTDWSFLRY